MFPFKCLSIWACKLWCAYSWTCKTGFLALKTSILMYLLLSWIIMRWAQSSLHICQPNKAFFLSSFHFPFPALTKTLLFFSLFSPYLLSFNDWSLSLVCWLLTQKHRVQITGERFLSLADIPHTITLPHRKVYSWEVNDLLKLQYWLTENKERMNTAGFLPTITPGLGRRHQSPLILICSTVWVRCQ